MKIDVILYSHFPNDVRPRKEAELLASKGHKLRIFCLRGPGEKQVEAHSKNIEVHRLVSATFDSRISPFKMLFFWIASIRAWSSQNGTTAIHAHDLSALPAGFVIALLHGLPLIYDSHEMFPEAARDRYGFIAYFVFLVLEMICCLKVSTLVGVSHAQIAVLHHRCKAPAIFVNNYPSLNEVDYSYHKYVDGPVIFGMSGYLLGTRGHAEVITALDLLSKNGTDIEFWIVGDGPEMDTLKKKAATLSYPCKFFGYIDSRTDMWNTISQFDYAIIANHPSRNYLVTSINRIYEYAALGVPFICPRYAGISDILIALNVPDFNPLDPNSIKDTLVTLMKHSRFELAENGRQQIETRFNWETSGKKLEYLYDYLSKIYPKDNISPT